ncbi:UvrD-helicase domain-containing protein [Bacillus sp. DNRA2]|uniref:HelD family protein n=1 Tax=Bacillus sp. DNRA2 TaxID=2723053 RepID=UPI00145F5E4E|nr:UvrD-helicase domain-containing protein [Bacillus sp. DNRA2]NMD71183.1 UvrD-helicase domain-containing protein [Bacillus sp. DNRA2]
MLNRTEKEERQHLEEVLTKLNKEFDSVNDKISTINRDVIEAKKYIWENIAELDAAEQAANRVEVSLGIDFGEKAVIQRRKIQKLLQSPYFGRVDFVEAKKSGREPFYIGIHAFFEENTHENIIYDWRAPVSSLFYDFELGSAYYQSPVGNVEGEVCLKRQYKIKSGVMEYMIESSLNINDEVLQKELSSTSDEKMKNIVATIQKEQNLIIRNETSRELIIQGVAGSGKTSVALHRVAFLLYRNKETLTSRNILIISPNQVFSDYISNVLPELGEENILEVRMEELARKELVGICDIQTFDQQVVELLADADFGAVNRIKYKATVDFYDQLESFAKSIETDYFSPVDIKIESVFISKKDILKSYNSFKWLPIKPRLEKIAANIVANYRNKAGKRLPGAISRKIKPAIKKMFKFADTLSLYKEFYQHIRKPDLFIFKKGKVLEYADAFPLMYLKIYLEGIKSYEFVKHLLVDEMQDYTPIQYAVLSKIFKCKKTILGDSSQSVNPYSSSSLQKIKEIFQDADTVELLKSYRSTVEITNFAKTLNPHSNLIPIERHGEEPVLIKSFSFDEEMKNIKKLMGAFLKSGHTSLGIICKSQPQAEKVYQAIKHLNKNIHLLTFNSKEYHDGIIITSAHMAKGLEFDHVIIPFTDEANYKTDLDKSLLYIACTRAMHKMILTYSSEISPFLKDRV